MKIIHPRFQPGRIVFLGIEFVDGVARVDGLSPIVEATLLQHGFTIEETIKPVSKLNKKELIAHAEGLGIEVDKSAKVDEIRSQIEAASETIEEPDTVEASSADDAVEQVEE